MFLCLLTLTSTLSRAPRSRSRAVLIALNKAILASHILGNAEGHRMKSLRVLIGPCIRHLLQSHTKSADEVLSSFRNMAETVTANMSTLIDAVKGVAISNQEQLQRFHFFFFMPAHSTLTEIVPGLSLPHHVGTQWLLRILREAMYNKTKKADVNLLERRSCNTTLLGLAYEASLLHEIREGQVAEPYELFGISDKSQHNLPQAEDAPTTSFTPLYQDAYLDHNTLPTLANSTQTLVTVAPSFPTVDAVIVTRNRVLLLQVTVASRHKMLQSGLNRVYQLVRHNEMLEDRKWHFVFLAPKKDSAHELGSSNAAKGLQIYAQDTLRLDFSLGFMAVPFVKGVSLSVLRRRWALTPFIAVEQTTRSGA